MTNPRQMAMVLDALGGRAKPATQRRALKEHEQYVLEVMERHAVDPVKHAAFLITIMKLEQKL